jgi:Lrp/AsnC family transcriptional regulator, leucine-responsive regulatory protein
MKLDGLDQSLLDLLISDGRLTNRELARRVGLSPSACLVRVKRLEANGVIVGYRALVARTGGGRRLEGWADIRLAGPTAQTVQKFLLLLTTTPEIVEAHRIAGQYDYAVRFCARDFEAWNAFRGRIAALNCEAQSRFSILVETLK